MGLLVGLRLDEVEDVRRRVLRLGRSAEAEWSGVEWSGVEWSRTGRGRGLTLLFDIVRKLAEKRV